MPGDHHAVNGGHQTNASTSANNSSGLISAAGTSNVEPEYDGAYVKVVGETIGIANLSEPCASSVGMNVTFAVKEMIEQAKKFACHGRRRRIISDDIDSALIFRGYPPQFGFYAKEGLPFRYAGSTGRDLFVTEEKDIDLAAVVNASSTKVPVDTAIKAHWLVIEGEQPAVPENPTPVVEEEASVSNAGDVPAVGETVGPGILSHAGKTLRKTEQVQIKTITTHILSVEQQIFFKEITEAIMGSDDARRTEALHSLQVDAGIQALLPRFSLAIAEGVRCNIVHHNLAILIYLMRMIQSLALNPALNLDRCLHELLPSVLSCILSKQLCARPDTDNHWALREFSSRLLDTISKAYNVNNLRSRITQVLTRVWRDEHATLATLYGSLYALNELGIDTVRAVIVPRAAQLYNDLRKPLLDKSNAAEHIAAEKLQNFVTKVLVNYVRTQRPSGLNDVNDYRNTFGGFGDAIFRAISMEVPYTSSAITNNVNSMGGASSMSRNQSDRRPMVLTNVPQRAVTVNAKQPAGTSRYVVRPQASPTMRPPGQQQFVNVATGGRLQPSNAAPAPRPALSTGYYVSSSNANASPGPYVVRPGVKKMVVTTGQRPPGSTNDGYRNM